MSHHLRSVVAAFVVTGTFGLAYYTLGNEIYLGVWGDRHRNIQPDRLRIMFLTGPANGRIAQSSDRVRRASARAGMHPSVFEIRETNGFYDLSWRARDQIHIAGYLWGTGIVLVDRQAVARFTDTEMDCVFAHEVGHILQYDQGYLATIQGTLEVQLLTIEVDADLRAAAICGEENWQLFFRRYIGTRAAIVK